MRKEEREISQSRVGRNENVKRVVRGGVERG